MGRGGSTPSERIKLGIVAQAPSSLLLDVRGPLLDFFFSDAVGEANHVLWRLGPSPKESDLAAVLVPSGGPEHPGLLFLRSSYDRLSVSFPVQANPVSRAVAQVDELSDGFDRLLAADPRDTHEARRDLYFRLKGLLLGGRATLHARAARDVSSVDLDIESEQKIAPLRGAAVAVTAMRWLVQLPLLPRFIAFAGDGPYRCPDIGDLEWADACPHALVARALARRPALSLEERLLENDSTLAVHGRPLSRTRVVFELDPPHEGLLMDVALDRVSTVLRDNARSEQKLSDHVLAGGRCRTCAEHGALAFCSVEQVRRRHGLIPLLLELARI